MAVISASALGLALIDAPSQYEYNCLIAESWPWLIIPQTAAQIGVAMLIPATIAVVLILLARSWLSPSNSTPRVGASLLFVCAFGLLFTAAHHSFWLAMIDWDPEELTADRIIQIMTYSQGSRDVGLLALGAFVAALVKGNARPSAQGMDIMAWSISLLWILVMMFQLINIHYTSG
jgi:alpha-D-ribose 1-methylphosphonate 5-triphosphate synthase subunit PhnH